MIKTTSSNLEIVQAYEQLRLTPAQIAQQFELEVAAVKALLMQESKKFKEDKANNPHVGNILEFSDDEFNDCKKVVLDIARYCTDSPAVQLKAAMYVCNDKKGYNDPRLKLPTLNVNVLDFNARMQKALEAEARTERMEIEMKQAKVLVEKNG